MRRLQHNNILSDLKKKMVFLVGPRQSGKTYLAKAVAENYKNSTYLNYDVVADRKIIEEQTWLPSTELLIFDELHKMPDWKNFVKGVFDSKPSNMHILVTGSARLDVYEQIGDSLAGRYFRHRLLPFSLAELKQLDLKANVDSFVKTSGFPEPFLSDSEVDVARWRDQYINSLLSTDIFDVGNIDNVKAMRLVFDMLRYRVGSVISYQSIARDVGISPVTVKKYISILEDLFIVFKVTPYSRNIARSILKEPKVYFFDTGLVEGDEGSKIENVVAFSLYKHCLANQDYLAKDYKLHFLRTKEGVEVDFAIAQNNSLQTMYEVKVSDQTIAKPLKTFKEKYSFEAVQLVHNLRSEFVKDDIQVLKIQEFISSLYL